MCGDFWQQSFQARIHPLIRATLSQRRGDAAAGLTRGRWSVCRWRRWRRRRAASHAHCQESPAHNDELNDDLSFPETSASRIGALSGGLWDCLRRLLAPGWGMSPLNHSRAGAGTGEPSLAVQPISVVFISWKLHNCFFDADIDEKEIRAGRHVQLKRKSGFARTTKSHCAVDRREIRLSIYLPDTIIMSLSAKSLWLAIVDPAR